MPPSKSLDLPRAYLCVLECVGEPNKYAMHGLHVDAWGLTCTDGKTLAHLEWTADEQDAYGLPEAGFTVLVPAGVVINGARARIDLTKLVEKGTFAPYRTVLPNVGDTKRFVAWAPDANALEILEAFARVGKAVARDAAGKVTVFEHGLSAVFQDPDVGEATFARGVTGEVLVDGLGFGVAIVAKALAAWRGGGSKDPNVFWPLRDDAPLVLMHGRLTVLAMPADVR